MHSDLGLNYFIKVCKQNNVKKILDIGSGKQLHTNILRKNDFIVETNDFFNADHIGDYNTITNMGTFDGIWCSHVLEHQLNPGDFLKKIHSDLNTGGILCITVPPRKDLIVGGHVSLWNAGLLLYHLILAGFDCKDASILSYHYNISIILKEKRIILPKLNYDAGDLDILKEYFPKGLNLKENFNGLIERHNWDENVKTFEKMHFSKPLIEK